MSQDVTPVRVLVVEDHADSRQMLRVLLSAAGYQVKLADGFASALAAATAEPFDVLLTDIGLPDGDGCDLLARIASMRPVRAVAVTGYSGPEYSAKFRDAGSHAVCPKPLKLDRLLSAIGATTPEVGQEA